MNIATILDRLAEGCHLSEAEAKAAFAALMDAEMSAAQAGAFLLTLRAKGETPQEMGAAVQAALARANLVTDVGGLYADLVGTGGDGKRSFNCSTAAALVLAALEAEGRSEVLDISHLDRGYGSFEYKLRSLGGDIVRVPL